MKPTSALGAVITSVSFFLPFLSPGLATTAEAADIQAEVALRFRAGEAPVDVFQEVLAPYGEWIETDRYGEVWTPRSVDHDWRPYRNGHWVYTECEWTWVEDEEWGWGPFHYGRWVFDPPYGWIWVPGAVWGPAWVAWRSGEGYVGWAALPPDVDLTRDLDDVPIDPFAYLFVEERYLPEPLLLPDYVPVALNVTIAKRTRNVTRYLVVENRIVNHGVPVEAVERAARRPVPRASIWEVSTPGPTRIRGNEVAVYRPPVPRVEGRGPSAVAARRPVTRPSPPPASDRDPHELRRRQLEERQREDGIAAKEREELRRLHAQQKASPPPDVSKRELQDRQRAEQRAQAEHEQRERKLLEERQARERKAAEVQTAQHREEKRREEKPREEKPRNP
jgi:hypothetical protein